MDNDNKGINLRSDPGIGAIICFVMSTVICMMALARVASAQDQLRTEVPGAKNSTENVEPYIQQLREEISDSTEEDFQSQTRKEIQSSSYLKSIREDLDDQDREAGIDPDPHSSYVESLKASDPEIYKNKPEESFIKKKKEEISELSDEEIKILDGGGAIQAYHEGRSELEAKKVGKINQAFGLRYGVSLMRDVTGSREFVPRDFKDIYGNNYAPSVSLFYEYQPFHSEWFGNIGIVGLGGVDYFQGYGQFAFRIENPGGGTFPLSSSTRFQFFMMPVTVGLDYRFNLFRIFRPYVLIGPTVIGYFEQRSDGIKGNRGYSRGYQFIGGVSILLDWLSSSSSWDLYANHSIKHYYLTIDYTQMRTIASDVNFSVNGWTAGLMFEL